ncbi:hypothetical protein ILUMI_26931 [Ignelater luminosus]|uniref:Uncharacterized protein n=1 Tax=Ignelater luminosus TaxID=2038154 RepID=A0A8K0C570_IGNLU|nr:hypothetical protein ILUMI_26931 [Ignelater luminosus]
MTKQRCSTCGTDDDDPVVIKISNQKSCHCTTSRKEKVEAAPFPFKENPKTTCVVTSASPNKEKTVYSEGSESMLSVVNINDKLPVLIAREHGPHCALEVSVLEKHAEGCSKRKVDRGGRNPLDDRVGSYDVVNRLVYRTCAGSGGVAGHGDAIKNSAKGFKLNDPAWFGKDLKEKRSRVETLPILPNYDNCVLRMQPTPSKKTNTSKAICAKDEPVVKPVSTEPLRTSLPLPPRDNLEVLSVYIRTDKSEKVPCGFQKMHYRGDSCKLHDPTERSKQILALQKVIDETSSGAEISKSAKTFHQERETQ